MLYKIARVIIGENQTFLGGEELLKQRGVEVTVLGNTDCMAMMQKYAKEQPEHW